MDIKKKLEFDDSRSVTEIESSTETNDNPIVHVEKKNLMISKIFILFSFFPTIFTAINNFVAFKIFRLRQKEFTEDILKKQVFFIYQIIVLIFIITAVGFKIPDATNLFYLISLLSTLAWGLLFLILLCLYVLFTRYKHVYEVCLFTHSLLFNGWLIYFLCFGYDKQGPIGNILYFFFVFVPVSNLFLKGKSYFWICVFILLLCTGATVDFICNWEISESFLMEGRRPSLYLQFYVMYGFVSIYTLFGYTIFMVQSKQEKKMIFDISEAIKTLDLDSEFIKKLLKKKTLASKVVKSMKNIVKNLRYYKSFMPDFENLYKLQSSSSTNSSALSSDSLSGNASFRSKNSGVSSEGTGGSSSSASNNNVIIKRKKVVDEREKMKQLYLFERNIVVMQISLLMSEEVKNERFNHPRDLQDLFLSFISIVLKECETSRGRITNIWNHDIRVTWNAESISVNSASKACETALKILSKWKKIRYANYTHIHMSILANVSVNCGNFGTREWKRFNVFGGMALSRLEELSLLGRKIGVRIILEGEELSEKLKYCFNMKQVDYNFVTEKNVFEVVGMKESSKLKGEEWLYAIREDLEEEKNVDSSVVGKLEWINL